MHTVRHGDRHHPRYKVQDCKYRQFYLKRRHAAIRTLYSQGAGRAGRILFGELKDVLSEIVVETAQVAPSNTWLAHDARFDHSPELKQREMGLVT